MWRMLVINATSSSLSGKFVLIYLVLLLFDRLLPVKTVTVSTQTSRLGKFLYFDPLDVLDFIPPRLDLIILWFSIEHELAGACDYNVHSSPVLSLFAVSTGQQETKT